MTIMTKIFISYRRDDSQYVTDSVYEHMVRHFGKDNVFLDVGSIPFGLDFRRFLDDQIAKHDVILVIIGSDWARIMQERADQQNDFVRIEIESALQQGKLVIPVLVKNAILPDFADLPASIQDLQWRNSATIRRQPDLENDCNRLAEGIRQAIDLSSITPVPTPQPEPTPPKIVRAPSIDLMPDPFGWIEIPGKGYSIAKYPVTNAQYAKFIEAGGYNLRQWWTESGWQVREEHGWTEPGYWNDPDWNDAEQPIVGVAWYEAVAFCLWLSDVTGEQIMLPTEAQWQYAAQGNDGRAYPWGDDWDCLRCNNSVSPCSSNITTLVTQYEGIGDSPFGIVDMTGNVWEWGLTDYDNQTNDANSNANRRVLHGGSYYLDEVGYFHCSYWGRYAEHTRDPFRGFRIARS
jgi:hypothetical protein